MKRMILVTLCAVMLFAAGTPVTARAACGGHRFDKVTGEYWEPTGQGYQHSYTGYDGITRGCSVNIMRKVRVECCVVCGTVRHVQTGEEDEWHSSCGSK
ncbi:MAG: hypothetical protein NC543_15375 [bacterium]|nr:hypothetical protein [bacterium]MCM1376721.1 hypothetical protein [Muribaculum sp.]